LEITHTLLASDLIPYCWPEVFVSGEQSPSGHRHCAGPGAMLPSILDEGPGL